MPHTQRDFDEANLEAKAKADEAMQSWMDEFLGHRAGGTLAAPPPPDPNGQPAPSGGPVSGPPTAAPASPEAMTGGY